MPRCASHSFSLVRGALASRERVCGQGAVDEYGSLVWRNLVVSAKVVRRHVHSGSRMLGAGPPMIFSVGGSAQPGIGARQAHGI
ncbi:hypothetical protein CPC08DRAFT_176462 [Agrocybe pediades]|nr:hypothetical protein CPC08DRAFT_176462 [Agrocybe pediades]